MIRGLNPILTNACFASASHQKTPDPSNARLGIPYIRLANKRPEPTVASTPSSVAFRPRKRATIESWSKQQAASFGRGQDSARSPFGAYLFFLSRTSAIQSKRKLQHSTAGCACGGHKPPHAWTTLLSSVSECESFTALSLFSLQAGKPQVTVNKYSSLAKSQCVRKQGRPEKRNQNHFRRPHGQLELGVVRESNEAREGTHHMSSKANIARQHDSWKAQYHKSPSHRLTVY